MSGLFRIGGSHRRGPEAVAGFRVQTSLNGVPIPIVYGKARIAANVIQLMDFAATAQRAPRSKVLGIPVSGAPVTGYNYQAALALGLCEGPVTSIEQVWREKDAPVDFSIYQLSGWGLFTGTSSQAAWSYVTTNHPSEAVPYQFTAYIACPTADLPNGTLQGYSWEVNGFLQFNAGGLIFDASVADAVYDLLTAANYGIGVATSKIASMTTFQDYAAAFGLFVSPVIAEEKAGREHLNALLEIGNTGVVWSDGKIKFIPYGDVAQTAHGHTFTPNTTPVYDLSDNDFLPRGQGMAPVTLKRRNPAEVANTVTVEIEDRDFAYNPVPYSAEDQDQILAYGRRPLPVLALHQIKDKDVGRNVAQIRLQREQNIRNTYLFNLGMKYSLLEPMDLVTLTDSGLGLSLTPVRITTIEELDGEAGFALTAEDWPLGTASATLYGAQTADGFAPDVNADPGDTTPFMLEPPVDFLSSSYDLWLLGTGGANWGGCDVYLSFDNTHFTQVGQITRKGTFGQLTAGLAAGVQWPSVDSNTISVQLNAGSTLSSNSSTDFNALVPLCWIEGEWGAYDDATLTGAAAYNLTPLYRGLYGTTNIAHLTGEDFAFIDSAVATLQIGNVVAGQTLHFKFASFNTFGNAVQDVATLTSVAFTVGRDPLNIGTATAQATTSVNPDGSWDVSSEGPSWAQSYKYATSTSSFPSEATVRASGTITNGRTFTASGSPGDLTLGDTLYMTILPYRGPIATGLEGPSFRARGTYQDFSATKTTRFVPNNLLQVASTGAFAGVGQFYFDGNYAHPVSGVNAAFAGTTILQIANGVTITLIEAELYTSNSPTPFTPPDNITIYLNRISGTGGSTNIGSTGSTSHNGWETKNFSCSEDTTGRQYQVYVDGYENDTTNIPKIAAYYVTFTMPSAVVAQ